MPKYRSTRPPVPLPMQTFFRCLDDTSQPPGYVGDWPVAGRVYSGRMLLHHETLEPQVYLDGFWAERPWGTFGPERFVLLEQVWLN
ncbi:MAG: hypothetical protein ACRYFX_10930 [Janthinobacterium lividum]